MKELNHFRNRIKGMSTDVIEDIFGFDNEISCVLLRNMIDDIFG
jgi:hypothetical protein